MVPMSVRRADFGTNNLERFLRAMRRCEVLRVDAQTGDVIQFWYKQ